MNRLFNIIFFLLFTTGLNAQCAADSSNIYTFFYNGKTYEIIKENLSWTDAVACAVDRGGKLAEITSQAEQDTIYSATLLAGITVSGTIAPDGGGASYLWIGGNDITTEGNWVWDGDLTNDSTHFWTGTASGSSVNGAYTNWGNEPDDFQSQDALGLAITNWPLGSASQWNDVDVSNTLYYIVEIDNINGIREINRNAFDFKLYPNPTHDQFIISLDTEKTWSAKLFDIKGQLLETVSDILVSSYNWKTSHLSSGVYFVTITIDGTKATQRIIID